MAKVRVYELAKELGVESRVVMAQLSAMGEFVRSASGTLEPAVVAAIRAVPPGDLPKPIALLDATIALEDDEEDASESLIYDEPHSYRRDGDLLDASEAADYADSTTATIRQWASRGHLRRAGTRGRKAVYVRQEVRLAAIAVRERTGGPQRDPALGLASKDLEALITPEEAGRLASIAPATIRVWVHRGRLVPAQDVPRLFRLGDVLSAMMLKPPTSSNLF